MAKSCGGSNPNVSIFWQKKNSIFCHFSVFSTFQIEIFHKFLPTNFQESLFSRIYWNFSKLDMTRPYIQEKSFNFGACDVDYSINTFYFILCRSRKSCPFAYGWRLKVELSWQSHRRPSPSGLNFGDFAVMSFRLVGGNNSTRGPTHSSLHRR